MKLCKSKEKAVACFHAFTDSTVLIKEEAAADLKDMWDEIDMGNGDYDKEYNKESEESEDEDLSLELEVGIVVDDGGAGGEEVRNLVKELNVTVKRLTHRMGTQGKEIESLRTQLVGGMRIEQFDTCIKKDNWADYRRDTYDFVNRKSQLLLGCSEVSGTVEMLQERVGELEMLKEDRVVTVPDKDGDAMAELQAGFPGETK